MLPLHDPELGSIHFKTHFRSTHITIRLVNDGLRITMPSTDFYNEALSLIEKNRSQILTKQKKRDNGHQIIDEGHPLKTLTFTAHVVASDQPKIFFKLADNVLTIEYPRQRGIQSPAVQKVIREGIVYFLRKAAKQVLPEKTFQLAMQSGLKYRSLKIQSSTTRWGSCSSVNNINLSLYLLLLPSHLIDYVIVHELCHTIEHNHSERFWTHVERILPDCKALRNELKHFSLSAWA
ncbi:M48 family metallopeptidase [Microbacter margulisiae]|uniref:YgjP-like metallopeptidase domain-containing protein n=1 Tax=Microbacter margulisiae TaxID=1350067 RepID=A0A7W5DRE2_9PORP|nr:M48 family metallopeptidase [Microbacter margulisiae]MBB3187709.1 hypothetical protein [Microbacter margulisiae]